MQDFADQQQLLQASRNHSTRPGAVVAFWLKFTAAFLVAIAYCALDSQLLAQKPGEFPPAKIVTDSANKPDDREGLPIRGFMFLDAAGNPVMIPTMTFEEYERLMQLESASKTTARPYDFKSLDINGAANDGRAQLKLRLRIAIDPTDGRLIPIPLKMGNFHLTGAPEFTGSPSGNSKGDVERIQIAPDGEGYILWARADKARETVITMTVSARADQLSTDSIYFQLPDVTTSIKVSIPKRNIVGEIDGRSDELITPIPVAGGTDLEVKSSGGSFHLRWGPQQQGMADTTAQFEVASDVKVTWDAPLDRPSLSVTWRIKSLRNKVAYFDVLMPRGSQFNENPILLESGRATSVVKMDNDRLRVTVPADERGQSVDVTFDLTLDPQDSKEIQGSRWQNLRVPQVFGALRHEGDIVLKTVGDFRLRWRSSRGVQRVIRESTDDQPNTRSYSFQFDRGSFVLPIQLTAQKQKLRITCESEVQLNSSSANLEMTIRSTGDASDSRQLEIDFAGWEPQSIVDPETLESLEIGAPGSNVQISLTRDDGGTPSVIQITASRSLNIKDNRISFEVPQLISSDAALLIESNEVTVRSSGRSALSVLSNPSYAIESVISANVPTDAMVSKFQIQPPTEKAKIVGTLVPQPPQLTLEVNSNVRLEGDQLVTTSDWTITSKFDLRGRLEIDIPRAVSLLTQGALPTLGDLSDTTGLGNFLNRAEESLSPPGADGWIVTVDGRAESLEHTERTHYTLHSDRLGKGTFTIRWTNTRKIYGDAIQSVSLPRPGNAIVEIRGDVTVVLSGNQQTELYAADASSRSTLSYSEMPREPIRLRLLKSTTSEQELFVRRAVLRSAVGKETRFEQVLASIQGGDKFRVGLRNSDHDLSAEAYVDAKRVAVHREDDRLVVQLPGDQETHIVDVRIWVNESSSGVAPSIKPMMRLPIGIGRVLWQIILPQDSHVVWAAATMGREMTWDFNRWGVSRKSIHSDDSLSQWIGETNPMPLPAGNRYLYAGSDIRSFEAKVATRASIWLVVGSIVLLLAGGLSYIPKLRTPMTAVAGVIAFAGLLAIAPDAAVLGGQFATIAMVLVIIMFAIRSLLAPRESDRVLAPYQEPRSETSTRTAAAKPATGSSLSATETAVPTGPSEVPS